MNEGSLLSGSQGDCRTWIAGGDGRILQLKLGGGWLCGASLHSNSDTSGTKLESICHFEQVQSETLLQSLQIEFQHCLIMRSHDYELYQ